MEAIERGPSSALSLSRQAHANPKGYQNVNLEYLVFFTSVKGLITIHLKLPKGLKTARETIMELFSKFNNKVNLVLPEHLFLPVKKRVNYYSRKTTQEVKKTQEKQIMKIYYKIIIKI